MVFSSVVFLNYFLPLALLSYFALGALKNVKIQNMALLLFSLLFYSWGETVYVLIMLASIGANYLFGRLLQDYKNKTLLFFAVAINLALLGYYKYWAFLLETLSFFMVTLGVLQESLSVEPVHLPIGISFFTFQSISYIVDVYKGDAKAQRSFINLALYISLFPQLVAGPIVRYTTVEAALEKRHTTLDMAYDGAVLFCIGLFKKVLIADTMAGVADTVIGLPVDDLTAPLAWLFITTYSLQIFFDFSGYSDMAIGLGLLLGFHYPVNFRQPYASKSIKEFWRRWHISLSSWFRDYLYIPLGGNKGGLFRTYSNLIIVFFVTGLWHGASWSFVVWGLYHGFFLILERQSFFSRALHKVPGVLKTVYVCIVVLVGWVFFRVEELADALSVIKIMFFGQEVSNRYPELFVGYYLSPWVLCILLTGLVWSLIPEDVINRLRGRSEEESILQYVKPVFIFSVFFITSIAVLASQYSPFIYFRF